VNEGFDLIHGEDGAGRLGIAGEIGGKEGEVECHAGLGGAAEGGLEYAQVVGDGVVGFAIVLQVFQVGVEPGAVYVAEGNVVSGTKVPFYAVGGKTGFTGHLGLAVLFLFVGVLTDAGEEHDGGIGGICHSLEKSNRRFFVYSFSSLLFGNNKLLKGVRRLDFLISKIIGLNESGAKVQIFLIICKRFWGFLQEWGEYSRTSEHTST
jgi:hypothetical protein